MRTAADAWRIIQGVLDERGVVYHSSSTGHTSAIVHNNKAIQIGTTEVTVELPGEHRLSTTALINISEHAVRIEAFVCRKPDENNEGVYRFLLRRNHRLYGVSYTLDNVGDIYLVGAMACDVVSADEIDRVLGQVLEAADHDFNTLLELGFATAIRQEWAWRVARGESLQNLQAFSHLVSPETTQR